MTADLSAYLMESVVHGHYVFKQVWSPVFGEVLTVDREPRNAEDRYAVAVVVQNIPVESHHFQLEFMHIALRSQLHCFHHVYSCPMRVAHLAQRSTHVRRVWLINSFVMNAHFFIKHIFSCHSE